MRNKILQWCRCSENNSQNFPVEVLFLRDDDIPQYVEQQVADIGILGENMVFEKNKDVNIIEQLGFALPAEPGNTQRRKIYRTGIFHEQKNRNQLPKNPFRLSQKK